MPFFVKRLHPGEDFRHGIERMMSEFNIEAGVIVSGVGSFTSAKLRLAGASKISEFRGPFEIVSVTGTVGKGTMHVHLSISDESGRTVGGHLVDGCIINTTAELVISAVDGWVFERTMDDGTGYPELSPKNLL